MNAVDYLRIIGCGLFVSISVILLVYTAYVNNMLWLLPLLGLAVVTILAVTVSILNQRTLTEVGNL